MRRVYRVGLVPGRDLCGTTEEQFGDLLIRLAPLATERQQRLAERPGRRRAPGAGRPPYPFWLRLLVALTHLRQGTTVRTTAVIFGLHERSVRRYQDEVEELLVAHGFQPPGAARPIRTVEDLAAYVDDLPEGVVMVDATEVPRSTPYPWEEQKKAYSGKSKTRVVKTTVVSDQTRRPLWVEANPNGEGRTFDVTMLRSQSALLAVLATLGRFRGAGPCRQRLPRAMAGSWSRRCAHAETETGRPGLRQEQREYNRRVSTARMPVGTPSDG